MAAPPPPPPRGTMSLYAELLGGPAAEPVAAAPTPDAVVKPSEAKNPGKNHPIIRRPQQKPKASAHRLKSLPVSLSTAPATTTKPTPTTTTTTTTTTRPTLADWAASTDHDEHDDHYDDANDNGGPRPLRGGRKRKKKRLDEKQQPHRRTGHGDVDWDELYDPARPTSLEAYLHSDERVTAVRDWKAVLYAHRRRLRRPEDDDDDNNSDSSDNDNSHRPNSAFAPPAAFAPPPSLTTGSSLPPPTADEAAHPRLPQSFPQPPPPPSAPAVPATASTPATAVPSLADGLVVSRAPVRFNTAITTTATDDVGMQGPDNDDDDDDAYEPPPASADDSGAPSSFSSARPGQAGFAARLMAKYGWTKGSGLGADGAGILNPLRHKKVGAANSGRGRIVGGGHGGRGQGEARGDDVTEPQSHVTSSAPSTVVVLRNMVEGMPDLAAEIADGQLVQEIGEECGEQYGRIERVYIDVPSKLVFIQFTDAVSALRAVTALDGRIFNGNAIAPSFYNADKFEQSIYE